MVHAKNDTLPEALKRLPRRIIHSTAFPPLVVLVAVLAITLWPWQNARQNLKHSYSSIVDSRVASVKGAITNNFQSYNNILQGMVGLYQANGNVTRAQWLTYGDATGLTKRYKGIQAISYNRIVSAGEIEQFTELIREQGLENFTIRPQDPNKPAYTVVVFSYPDNKNYQAVAGFDMSSEPTRKATLDTVRDSGQSGLTGKLRLVQADPSKTTAGFLMYAPLYTTGSDTSSVPARQAAIAGYVSGAFIGESFFKEVLGDTSDTKHYSLKIYDTSVDSKNLLYQSDNSAEIAKHTHADRVVTPLSIVGRTWQLEFTFDRDFVVSTSEKNTPIYILLVGVATALLVFFILLMILRSRSRELQLQKEHEVELAKDELLSLASHQMRTPATGVKQYLGMVLQGFAGTLPSSQKKMLERAYTSNERQLHVINQVLHLAKLESGRVVLSKHETDINELITDIVDEQRKEAESHGHKVVLRLPKQPVLLEVDSHMLRMAIENLLSNAIKYTLDSGTIRVRVSQQAKKVLIQIKDSGIGIAAKDHPLIFKQFSRLYNDKAAQVSGTGVGLYLTDQLVKLHGGSVELESQLGKGSEFTITLLR